MKYCGCGGSRDVGLLLQSWWKIDVFTIVIVLSSFTSAWEACVCVILIFVLYACPARFSRNRFWRKNQRKGLL